MADRYGEWVRKGATFSDKTARKEFGLTEDEVDDAIRAGKLQYRVSSMQSNPWLRLLRSEVEELVKCLHGEPYLRQRLAKSALTHVDQELKRLRGDLAELEERRSQLLADLKG